MLSVSVHQNLDFMFINHTHSVDVMCMWEDRGYVWCLLLNCMFAGGMIKR